MSGATARIGAGWPAGRAFPCPGKSRPVAPIEGRLGSIDPDPRAPFSPFPPSRFRRSRTARHIRKMSERPRGGRGGQVKFEWFSAGAEIPSVRRRSFRRRRRRERIDRAVRARPDARRVTKPPGKRSSAPDVATRRSPLVAVKCHVPRRHFLRCRHV